MRNKTTVAWVLFALVVIFSCGCEKQSPATSEPVKPSTVPASALWVGGIDGGVFVLLSKPKELSKDLYSGVIYYESGDVAYKGIFKIYPSDAVVIDVSKKEIYQGWDGDTLYLSEDRYLKVSD